MLAANDAKLNTTDRNYLYEVDLEEVRMDDVELVELIDELEAGRTRNSGAQTLVGPLSLRASGEPAQPP